MFLCNIIPRGISTSKILTSIGLEISGKWSSKNHTDLLWIPNFIAFSMTLLTLKNNFPKSVQDIRLKLLGLSCVIYFKHLANFYQILRWDQIMRWVMSKPQTFCTIWCGMTHIRTEIAKFFYSCEIIDIYGD